MVCDYVEEGKRREGENEREKAFSQPKSEFRRKKVFLNEQRDSVNREFVAKKD